MNPKLSLLIAFACTLNYSFAQNDASRIQKLESRLNKLDKKEYDSISKTILNAAEKFPVLIKEYEILDVKSDFTDLFTKLTQAANPNNDSILGKSYTSIIKDEATKILTVDLKEEAKNGFSIILNKITSIPIIGAIINSNPVASLASQVITSASNFLTQKINGCAFCEKAIKYTDGINQKKIDSFSNKIQPLVSYYDRILFADRTFSQNLEVFKSIVKDKREEAAKTNSTLKTIFEDVSNYGNSTIAQINKIISVTNENYRDIIDDDRVQKGYEASLRYKYYETNLQAYNDEFSKMFSIYLQTYSESLIELKKYAIRNNYSTTSIGDLQNRIKTFIYKYAKPKGGIQDDSDPNKVNRIKVFK